MMIPKRIHYCWFGGTELPDLAQKCIASWHEQMPDYEYVRWDETTFNIHNNQYTKEAYQQGKYAFVSDYVRLYALREQGGIYMDVDFYTYQPFDNLLANTAFAGIEGSKHKPVMMGVLASEKTGIFVSEMLHLYDSLSFVKDDGSLDLTTNVQRITAAMVEGGYIQNGTESTYKDLHIFPVEYFCPHLTTGEYIRTANTYCEHLGLNSWSNNNGGWKEQLLKIVGNKNHSRLIKLKRKIFG